MIPLVTGMNSEIHGYRTQHRSSETLAVCWKEKESMFYMRVRQMKNWLPTNVLEPKEELAVVGPRYKDCFMGKELKKLRNRC